MPPLTPKQLEDKLAEAERLAALRLTLLTDAERQLSETQTQLSDSENRRQAAEEALQICLNGRSDDQAAAAEAIRVVTAEKQELQRLLTGCGEARIADETNHAAAVRGWSAEVSALAGRLEEKEHAFDDLQEENAQLKAKIEELLGPITARQWVDKGAEELASYIYDRMPGLKVSEFLGGPNLSTPHKETSERREVMQLHLSCSDGRLYSIDVYRSGNGN